MTDCHALPADHVLKPLEDRLLEMCADTHPAMRVLMGNAVAALRVFAGQHPGLVDRTIHCAVCDLPGPELPPRGWWGTFDALTGERFYCPDHHPDSSKGD